MQWLEPEYHFMINVQKFIVELENKQLQQAISFSETLKEFTEKRRPKLSISLSSSSKTEAKLLGEFKEIYSNYYNMSHMSMEESERYEKIIKKVELSELLTVVKEVVKTAERKKMLEEKSLKKTGWFTWTKQELTPEEI